MIGYNEALNGFCCVQRLALTPVLVDSDTNEIYFCS